MKYLKFRGLCSQVIRKCKADGCKGRKDSSLPRNTETSSKTKMAFVLGQQKEYIKLKDIYVIIHEKGQGMLRLCYKVI